MRLVAIGDIGIVDAMMHIGDEAMFEALSDELGARGAEIVAVSSAPDESAARYRGASVGRIRFDGLEREASERRLAAVVASASGASSLPEDDPAWGVITAVAEADAVVIAGAGNLASTWPLHVYERAALGGIARAFGKPLAITGQTFGPDLRGRDRELVAQLARSAALVGVRETASQALAAEFGVDARLGVDDASFLGFPIGSGVSATAGTPDGAGVLVSLSLSLGGAPRAETVERVARLVDAAAETVGGPVVFHAHFGAAAGTDPRGDAVLHDEVRERMQSASTVLPTGEPRAAADAARRAGLLITGRYHPAVFASPAGVPVLGLTTDGYTVVKQRGALAHWGQSATVPIARADADGIPHLQSLWTDRERLFDEAAARRPAHRGAAAEWWDRIAALR